MNLCTRLVGQHQIIVNILTICIIINGKNTTQHSSGFLYLAGVDNSRNWQTSLERWLGLFHIVSQGLECPNLELTRKSDFLFGILCRSRRHMYALELQKHIEVEILGGCGQK